MAYTSVSELAGKRYVSLTTFRRDGSEASTPVWVAGDGRQLLVWTGRGTWKVKRLRRDARVLVAASNARGVERGERIAGVGRVLDDTSLVDGLLRKKYGWQKRAVDLLNRRKTDAFVTIEIVDAGDAETPQPA
jgi:uncharacterized protein